MITLSHVYKAYLAENPCLKDISFHIEKGEFVYLIGPSGAGKTTLFKIISAYESKTSGSVQVLGHDLSLLKPGQIPFLRRKIGFVLQNYKLLKNKTVFENIELPLLIQNYDQAKRKYEVSKIIERLKLSSVQDQYPEHLSGGEQQRTAIARALVHKPAIIIADEPTGNLDYPMSEIIMQIFKELSQEGLTFLMATHDERLIKKHSGRILKVNNGQLSEVTNL